MAALIAAGLAGVLVLATVVGAPLLAAGVAVVVLVLTWGAIRPAEVPGSGRAAGLALVVGLGGLAGLIVQDGPDLGPLTAVLGPSLVVAIALQVARRDGRPRLTASLTLAVTACALALLPATWVALRASVDGQASVLVGLTGVGVACLLEGLPGSRAMVRTLSVLVAGGSGALLSLTVLAVRDAAPPLNAVTLATFAAVATAAANAAVDRIAAEARVPAGAGGPSLSVEPGAFLAAVLPLRVSLPFVVAAPVTYVLGRILVG
ncbi:MAG TPA: hypothetical protein VK894_13475 [Jiangellales bacterium]|nr:hypothetical protein [Jiangellales bacterium]